MRSKTAIDAMREDPELSGTYDTLPGSAWINVKRGDGYATIDGELSIKELKALIKYMQSKP